MNLGGLIRGLLGWSLLLMAMALPTGGGASAQPADSRALHHHCHTTGALDADPFASVTSAPVRDCSHEAHSIRPERTILHFDLAETGDPPRFMVTRRSPVEAVHVLAVDADGSRHSASFSYAETLPSMIGGFIKVPLPGVTGSTRSVHVAFDMPTHIMTLEQAHLAPGDPGEHPGGQRLLLMLAALCGMLLMPLIFNAAFYRILREPFVLWHALLTVALMLTILLNSGLSNVLVALDNPDLSRATTIVFGLSVAAGGMFAHHFIEPDRLNPWLRKALVWGAIWSLGLSFAHANFPFVGRSWQSDAYYIAYLPVLLLYIATMADALWRGSRAAKFQLVGWVPLLGVGIVRIVSQFSEALPATDAMQLFYLGCVFEVMATTLGVADRFMSIKNQRDRARTEARMLERLTERDTLTGLYNRRLLEERFEELRHRGFTTLAVLDIDHFKRINDSFGHGVGDEVLRGIAEALQPDDDTFAIRMGGEEFVLLLRGSHAIQRAEHRRVSIPDHIGETLELGLPVTASMGVVQAPIDALPNADFEMLYARADRLLYEAKESGRNRTMSEKTKLFSPRRRDRRAA